MDHVRGVAVLWVVLFHGFYATYDAPVVHPVVGALRAIAAPGWMGVHLFFVVSGYCITASARRVHAIRCGVVHFARDRIYRIFPVYWAALATTLVADALLWPATHGPLQKSLPHDVTGWIGNLLLIQPYIGTSYSNIVYWSLVVELGFYVIVVALLLLARATSWRTALVFGLGLGVVAAALPPDLRLRVECVGYFPEFVCGSAVFVAVEAWQAGKRHVAGAALAVIVGLGVVGSVLPHPPDAVLPFASICASALLVAAPFDRALVAYRPLRPLAWVGTLSYSLYLTHLTFTGRAVSLGTRFVAPTGLVYVALEAVAAAVGIGAAYLFYSRVELPLNAWRKASQRNVTPPRSAAPSSAA